MKKSILLLTGLLLFTQVIHSQNANPNNADRWIDQIYGYYADDERSFPAPGGILFVGSSTMRIWAKDIDQYFPDHYVFSRGFGGACIREILYYMPRIVWAYKPAQIVLYAGANDLSRGASKEQVLEDIRCFVRMCQIQLPGVKIILPSFRTSPNSLKRHETNLWLNERLKAFCESSTDVDYVDVSSMMYGADGNLRRELYQEDGIHLMPEAYRMFADKITPLLVNNKR